MSNAFDELKKQSKKLPDAPGVYFFKKNDEILYIGKATSLKGRVQSYFSKDLFESRGPLLVKVINESNTIEYKKTETALEALLLETYLIKLYKPVGNTKEKDNKSYAYICITKEEYPHIVVIRGRELETVYDLDEFMYVYGPFVSTSLAYTALSIIRKIFPFLGKESQKKSIQSTLYEQIGLVPNKEIISAKEYKKTIRHIVHFFEGKRDLIEKELEAHMVQASKEQRFEDAKYYKDTLFKLKHIKDIAIISRDFEHKKNHTSFCIESYDVAHLQGDHMVGVMVVLQDDVLQKHKYRKFTLEQNSPDDLKALRTILERRLQHAEWEYPHLIVVDGGPLQHSIACSVLEKHGLSIPVISVVKDDRHRPKGMVGPIKLSKEKKHEILLSNQEAHRFALSFHKQKRSSTFLPKT